MYYEDEIYHSGYLDGYYAGMELYHADDSEMTEEERRARRKKRRRNIALGVGAGAALGVGGYAVGRALRKRKGPKGIPRVKVDPRDVETPIGWDFKRNKPRYASDERNEAKYRTYERLKRWREVDGTNGTVRDLDPTEPFKRFFK